MKSCRPLVSCTVAGLVCAIVLGCDSPSGPEEVRVLGVVATPSQGIYFPGIEDNPTAWIVEGRRIKVAITTVGVCSLRRTDWDVTLSEGGSFRRPGLAFILPYEIRELDCDTGQRGGTRPGSPRIIHTDTLELSFQTALEATVRIVSGGGEVFEQTLDFLPGWPPEES